MFRKLNLTEYSLVFSVAFLLIVSIIIIASVSSVPAQEKLGTPYYYIIRHIIYIIIGVSFGFVAFKININLIKKYSLIFLTINILLLALVLKFGFSAGGATRWLAIGPFTIQPSEFLKLTFLIYSCFLFSKITEKIIKKRNKNKNNSLGALLIYIFLFVISALVLFKQRDASGLVILFSILLITYFLSGTSIWKSILISFAGLGGLFALIKLTPYRLDRLLVFLNPELDPMGKGYQIKQISIAIGSGGLFGLGLGMSRQKLGFLPEAMTDAVFAVFSEEAGFIGAGLVILLFIVFLWSGLTISKNCSDKFSSLLCAGITSWIMIQALINIGAMLKILPLTGVPLPFVSYGGSHMVAELIGTGLLLNISRKSRIK